MKATGGSSPSTYFPPEQPEPVAYVSKHLSRMDELSRRPDPAS